VDVAETTPQVNCLQKQTNKKEPAPAYPFPRKIQFFEGEVILLCWMLRLLPKNASA
jgi:hypothetical protein